MSKVKIRIGSHLVSQRVGYTHHGVYIGGSDVIHYSGLADGLNAGPVEKTTLDNFSAGYRFKVKEHPDPKFNSREIVTRAKSRLGEELYSLLNNNCEHFVNWCIDGDHASTQVDIGTGVGGGTISSAVGLGGRAVVASAGPVAGLSGSGIMGGLASVGGTVGGGAVAGMGAIAGAGGIAAASLINNTLLKDSEAFDTDERESRSLGRKATYAGAAAGTAGGVAAVSAMGTTAGLSAAGITSGLAAVGGTVGGGMAAGTAVVAAAPVAAAVAVGYGLYKMAKWLKG